MASGRMTGSPLRISTDFGGPWRRDGAAHPIMARYQHFEGDEAPDWTPYDWSVFVFYEGERDGEPRWRVTVYPDYAIHTAGTELEAVEWAHIHALMHLPGYTNELEPYIARLKRGLAP